MEFKDGDKVILIQEDKYTQADELKLYNIYTINGVYTAYISIEGAQNYFHLSKCFILADNIIRPINLLAYNNLSTEYYKQLKTLIT